MKAADRMQTVTPLTNEESAIRDRAVAERPARILIGPMSSDPTESVSGVNAAFVKGLEDRYRFLPLDATRRYGTTRQSMLNGINLFYFVRQLFCWIMQLMVRRPALAHYAISSGWAMEKGLVLMKLARLLGAKTLGHLHSGEFIDHWKSLSPKRKKFALREFSRLDGLVLASQWWCDEIRKYVPLPPEKFYVVNNPIDPAFERSALAMPTERRSNAVLTLGTMGRAKGVFDMLTAAEVVRHEGDFVLKMAGAEREPNILKEVRAYIADHSLSSIVHLQSAVSPEEKITLYRNCSVFLLPSYYENFPLVLVEAAAAGLAIVTTPVGAVPEFFQDGVSALFVEPGNPKQIAEALQQLIREPQKRMRMGLAAREMFTTRLARRKIMESLDGVYRRVIS